MERNLIALNTTLNFAEIAALIVGYYTLDKRIKKLEGKSIPEFNHLEVAASIDNNKIERNISTTCERLDKHEEVLFRIVKELSILKDNLSNDSLNVNNTLEYSDKNRLTISPNKSSSKLKGRSRIISDYLLEKDVINIDLEDYSHLN